MYKITIIDGYVDEPTCLGVPPYISPYPRYIAGSIWDNNSKNQVFYNTIDQIRNNKENFLKFASKSDIVITIAGTSVPGRYLSGFPAGPSEIKKLMSEIVGPIKIFDAFFCVHFAGGSGDAAGGLV